MKAGTSTTAAFFDVDRTLIAANSGQRWIFREVRERRISLPTFARSLLWLAQYRLGTLDFDGCAEASLARYKGRNIEELGHEMERFAAEELLQTIPTQARTAVEEHRQLGHRLVVLSSGTELTVGPIARALGISEILCTELEVENGSLTGKLRRPTCFGPGKVLRARSYAQAHQIDLRESFFYSDSQTDLPMFDEVGHPRVINPDRGLRRIALARRWPVHAWPSPLQ
jgi:HAD superfamily hydrolase (TIGR01490 family)